MTAVSEQVPTKRKVIVADDEDDRHTLAIILNQAGFEARAVFSGKQVVELLDSFALRIRSFLSEQRGSGQFESQVK